MAIDERFPDEGEATIRWNVSIIDGDRRLGWSFETAPRIDLQLAHDLVADVAKELAIDLGDRE